MGKFKETNHPAQNGGSHRDGSTQPFDREALKVRLLEDEEQGAGLPDGRKAAAVWRYARPALIFLISLSIIAVFLLVASDYVYNNYISPVDPEGRQAVTVEIRRGSSVTAIAQTLFENGLIRSKTVFKFYVDFSDMTSKLKAGTYTLSADMTMDDIIYALSKGDGRPKVTRFIVTEGMTVEDMAGALLQKGVIKDRGAFLALCRKAEDFYSYPFIAELDPAPEGEPSENDAAAAAQRKEHRKYLLEGYLFPDTYEIFTDSPYEAIIGKMLDRFAQVFGEVYMERADELNMTIDEAVTLASLIEREGKTQEFTRISAVFHNRLKKKMALGSDATMHYVTGVNKLTYTQEERKIDSPYNTYLHKGLPAGPIANPGKRAIEAALYPDEQYLKDGYLYFCLKDPATGEHAFAKTLREHEKNIEKYSHLWKVQEDDG